MTFIRGDSGWIVVDPLVTSAPAAEGLRLLREHVADLPVVAVLSTHSHADHFAGIAGWPTAKTSRRVACATSSRSASWKLPWLRTCWRATSWHAGPHTCMAMPCRPAGRSRRRRFGAVHQRWRDGFYPPTDIVDHTGQELVVDGVRFIFQYTPDAGRRPSTASTCPSSGRCAMPRSPPTLHNLYTLRGAKMRDALAWSSTCMSPCASSQTRPMCCSPRTTGPPGALLRCATCWWRSATCTATCTTRRCGWPTTATAPPRSRKCWNSPTASDVSSPTAATTAASTTTSKPCTTTTWAGSTATLPTCTRCRRWPRAASSSSAGGAEALMARRGPTSTPASTAGWPGGQPPRVRRSRQRRRQGPAGRCL